jgi:hypothetical protein
MANAPRAVASDEPSNAPSHGSDEGPSKAPRAIERNAPRAVVERATEPSICPSGESQEPSAPPPPVLSCPSYPTCFLWGRHQHPPRRLHGGDSPPYATSKGDSTSHHFQGGHSPFLPHLAGYQAAWKNRCCKFPPEEPLHQIAYTCTRATPPSSPQHFPHFSFFTSPPWQQYWCFPYSIPPQWQRWHNGNNFLFLDPC